MRRRRKEALRRTMIRAGILVALLAILCAMLFVPDRKGQSLFAYLYDQLLEADINLKRRYVPDYYALSELYDLHSFCKWYFPDFEYYWTYRELMLVQTCAMAAGYTAIIFMSFWRTERRISMERPGFWMLRSLPRRIPSAEQSCMWAVRGGMC